MLALKIVGGILAFGVGVAGLGLLGLWLYGKFISSVIGKG